jgi:predicted nucleic acid-binding Zn ribbon protein
MKESMDAYLKAMGIDKKMQQVAILNMWDAQMGEAVAARTESKIIREGVLVLEINSSVMRDELSQSKTNIMDWMNEAAGFEMVKDVFFK